MSRGRLDARNMSGALSFWDLPSSCLSLLSYISPLFKYGFGLGIQRPPTPLFLRDESEVGGISGYWTLGAQMTTTYLPSVVIIYLDTTTTLRPMAPRSTISTLHALPLMKPRNTSSLSRNQLWAASLHTSRSAMSF